MGRKYLLVAALTLAGAIPGAGALADTRAGVDAWSRGDFTAAVREWQGDAGRGDADAQFNLGQAYRLGKGVPQDMAKAEELFGKAAAAGHVQASDNYGLLLFQRGERTKALPFIRAAADRGDPRAQYLLGIAHFNGDMVARDWVRAYALVSLAQQAGLDQARQALIQMDTHVPLAQRQEAVALAGELQSQAEATRARQLAAADLGASPPTRTTGTAPVVTAAPRPPVGTRPAVDSPATAGADYARPAFIPPTVTFAAPPAPGRPVATATAAAPARPPVAPATPAADGWRIQLGAFGVAANADALWNKVKGRPELAGHPRINQQVGAVIKLQAGSYPGEASARAACARLVADGLTCIAVRN